jgi:hypothetical protein
MDFLADAELRQKLNIQTSYLFASNTSKFLVAKYTYRLEKNIKKKFWVKLKYESCGVRM